MWYSLNKIDREIELSLSRYIVAAIHYSVQARRIRIPGRASNVFCYCFRSTNIYHDGLYVMCVCVRDVCLSSLSLQNTCLPHTLIQIDVQ
jgi:hypothetical protein